MSTILQLTGELNQIDPSTGEKKPKEVLKLTTTKKLPSLEGFTWDTLHEDIKRIIKRSKFAINIILTENSIQAQYELFQRLNTGGLYLEPQEIRNCLIIMLNEPFYEELNKIKEYGNFKNSLKLQEVKLEIEFHMELILRYFISKHDKIDFAKYKMSSTLLSEFIDDETIALIADKTFILNDEIAIFKRTFTYLFDSLGTDIFRKYNIIKGEFEGGFSLSSFEAITTGVALNIDIYEKMKTEDFKIKIIKMYSEADFLEYSKRGNKALSRIKGMLDFSKKYFKL